MLLYNNNPIKKHKTIIRTLNVLNLTSFINLSSNLPTNET